jgi:hypothetical protein
VLDLADAGRYATRAHGVMFGPIDELPFADALAPRTAAASASWRRPSPPSRLSAPPGLTTVPGSPMSAEGCSRRPTCSSSTRPPDAPSPQQAPEWSVGRLRVGPCRRGSRVHLRRRPPHGTHRQQKATDQDSAQVDADRPFASRESPLWFDDADA